MTDPGAVVLVGDVHGNARWMLNYVIPQADRLLEEAGQARKIIIQLGDFGFRLEPGNRSLEMLDMALDGRDLELWWLDGNHEDWPGIQSLLPVEHQFDSPGFPAGSVPLPGLDRIRYLPRGTRWTWAGRTWLAVGGAVSVDRLLRTEGESWWPDEEITDEEERAVIAGGPADVLLSHDVPDDWFPADLGPPADARLPMLPLARAHSRRLQRIADATGVTRVFHGHYHVERRDFYGRINGVERNVTVTGLPPDGYTGNILLIDVERP